MARDIQAFLNQMIAWAQSREDALSLALVGSYARGAAREDSDVDLVIIAVDPGIFLRDPSWTNRYGSVDRSQTEDYGNLTSLRVWYQDGLEVEYGLTDRSWAARPLDAGARRVIEDGLSVLFEREDLLSEWDNHAFKNRL